MCCNLSLGRLKQIIRLDYYVNVHFTQSFVLKIKKKFLQLHCLRCDISLQNKHSSSLEPSSQCALKVGNACSPTDNRKADGNVKGIYHFGSIRLTPWLVSLVFSLEENSGHWEAQDCKNHWELEGGRRPGRHVALPRPVIAQDTEQMWSWFLRGGRTFHTNNTQGLRRSLHSIMTAALREQVLLFIYLVIYLLIYILTVVVVFVLLGVQVHSDTSESKVVIHIPYRSIIG